ncbi:hypothetical protein [Synechocystis sp. PCC 7509]|uniref:hypothetical protein n=1 Tax=Synechocystis sp. PCC 7509 TaxID=927677 RepID=UPI0002ABF03E|nr:hypothetical protein [Synechocystis sp. PCC 7509]
MSDVEKSDLEIVAVDSDEKPFSKKGKSIDQRSTSEKAKAWIVKALVIIFGSTIACCFALVIVEIIFPRGGTEDWKDIVTLVLVAETGIIGTVIGLYFGEVSKS